MNKQKKLLYGQALFAIIVMIIFSLIIIKEKKNTLLMPKVQKKIDTYIEEKFNNLKNTRKSKITIKNNKYIVKISSKENKNLYFYIIYSNRKITDTFKKDYLEGNSLLRKIEKDIENDIIYNLKIKPKITIDTKLNNFNNQIQEMIIKEDVKKLKIYNIEIELTINKWNKEEITNDISNIINALYTNGYNPKSINIIITNKEDITESYRIKNLNKEFPNDKLNIKIIEDILANKETDLLKKHKITFEKLN